MEVCLVWALLSLSVVAVVVLGVPLITVLLEVLEVAAVGDSTCLAAAPLPSRRRHCHQVQPHTETKVETPLMVGISTVLVAEVQALLGKID
jgi:hypothetical protein